MAHHKTAGVMSDFACIEPLNGFSKLLGSWDMDPRNSFAEMPAGKHSASESVSFDQPEVGHKSEQPRRRSQTARPRAVGSPANRKMASAAFYLNEMMQDLGNNERHTFCG
jgi:hypothetical protein